jgi:hypothetical protein
VPVLVLGPVGPVGPEEEGEEEEEEALWPGQLQQQQVEGEGEEEGALALQLLPAEGAGRWRHRVGDGPSWMPPCCSLPLPLRAPLAPCVQH